MAIKDCIRRFCVTEAGGPVEDRSVLRQEKWISIKNPAMPMYHYAAFGEPLSEEQLKRLAQPVK